MTMKSVPVPETMFGTGYPKNSLTWDKVQKVWIAMNTFKLDPSDDKPKTFCIKLREWLDYPTVQEMFNEVLPPIPTTSAHMPTSMLRRHTSFTSMFGAGAHVSRMRRQTDQIANIIFQNKNGDAITEEEACLLDDNFNINNTDDNAPVQRRTFAVPTKPTVAEPSVVSAVAETSVGSAGAGSSAVAATSTGDVEVKKEVVEEVKEPTTVTKKAAGKRRRVFV